MKPFGFSFDVPPGVVLNSCHYNRKSYWKACAKTNMIQHPCWVLDYSLNGGLLECSTPYVNPGVRGPNTAHLYPPGQPYYQRILHSGYESSAWILFSGEIPFLRQLLENSGHFLRIRDPEHILYHLLIEIAETAIQGNSRYWKCQAKFCEILDCLNRLTPEDDGYSFILSNADTAKETFEERVVNYLETHYQKKLTMQMIASDLGVSISSLAHRYKMEKGENVMDTLLRIRIEQSLPLLSSGLPLKFIAENVGFCNEFYFSRQFRRLQKQSPGSWRNKISSSGKTRKN